MFKLNESYTRDQIHATLGGSIQSYLPTASGRVVCACLTNSLNNMAPGIIYAGVRPIVMSSAKILCEQGGSIPVFMKKASNDWRYYGDYAVEKYSDSPDEIKKHSALAGRPLSMVIYMKKVD